MTTPDRTLTHWPDWMRTAGALLRSNSLVRSHCRVCGALLRIDLASLVARHGADWNLIDRRERCTMCDGRLRRLVGLSGVMDLRSCVARAVERRWRLGHSRGQRDGGGSATIDGLRDMARCARH